VEIATIQDVATARAPLSALDGGALVELSRRDVAIEEILVGRTSQTALSVSGGPVDQAGNASSRSSLLCI